MMEFLLMIVSVAGYYSFNQWNEGADKRHIDKERIKRHIIKARNRRI